MACRQKQSGQGAYRNGRKPNLHQGVPGVEHFNDKRRYFKKSLAGRRAELIAETKDWIDWEIEEVEDLMDQEWHELDCEDKQSELDEYDKLLYDSLPETLEGDHE